MIRGVGALMSVLMLFFLAHGYGVDMVGVYQSSLSFFIIISMICSLGFHRLVLRQFSTVAGHGVLNNPANCFLACLLVSSIMLFFVFIGLGAYIYLVGAGPIFTELSRYIFICLPLCIVSVCVAYIKARSHTELATFCESVVWQGIMLLLFIVAYLLDIPLSIATMTMIFLFAWLLAMFASLFATSVKTVNMATLYPHIRYLCRAGIAFLLIDLASVSQIPITVLLLAYLSDSKNVGLFAVVCQLFLVFQFIVGAINNIYAPRLASAYLNKDHVGLYNIACCNAAWMYLTMLPLLILLYVFADWWLLLFGAEFYSAGGLVNILLLGQLFNILLGPVDTILIMADKIFSAQCAAFVGIFTGLVFAVWLIPEHGALGAMVSLSIIVSVSKIIAFIAVKRYLGFYSVPDFRMLIKMISFLKK